MTQPIVSGMSGWDLAVVLVVLLLTTWVGERMAGKQSSLNDFFLGGRRLPWWAVSASIVATEISAVTYVSLPSVVFREGGNMTYLQIVLIGSFLARAFVAYVLVPAYYQRSIYSPYDYVADRLGEPARRTTTALFTLGGLLGQSARVYMTAVVLLVVLAPELAWIQEHTGLPPLVSAVTTIGVVAIAWTWIGGVAAVVWTDAILFGLFIVGVGVTLWTVHRGLDQGLASALSEGYAAGKFQWIDTTWDPTRAYTLWAACLAASWGGIGSYGTDQLMAQRIFCCQGPREARKAVLASIVAVVIVFCVALVGVALWAFYQAHPLEGALAEEVAARPDKIYPLFLTTVLPVGLRGLVLAGIFAAAISSLDSILAALSQTTWSAWIEPARKKRGKEALSAQQTVAVSRWLVVLWGVVLCALAVTMEVVARYYASILDLALAMAGYAGGALLAAFFTALLRTGRDARGLPHAAALSVLWVFAVSWHAEWAQYTVGIGGLLVAGAWAAKGGRPGGTGLLFTGTAAAVALSRWGTFERAGEAVSLAWPWFIPLGSTVAFAFTYFLGEPEAEHPARSAAEARSTSPSR